METTGIWHDEYEALMREMREAVPIDYSASRNVRYHDPRMKAKKVAKRRAANKAARKQRKR